MQKLTVAYKRSLLLTEDRLCRSSPLLIKDHRYLQKLIISLLEAHHCIQKLTVAFRSSFFAYRSSPLLIEAHRCLYIEAHRCIQKLAIAYRSSPLLLLAALTMFWKVWRRRLRARPVCLTWTSTFPTWPKKSANRGPSA